MMFVPARKEALVKNKTTYPRKLIHAKVTMGNSAFTYTFSCRIDQKEANIKYVMHKNEQSKETITFGSQEWTFSAKTWYYEAITAGYKEKENNWLANFCFGLFQCSQIASSPELMRIATEAINEAVKQKEPQGEPAKPEKNLRKTNKKAKDGIKDE